jgi:hypothetical protein
MNITAEQRQGRAAAFPKGCPPPDPLRDLPGRFRGACHTGASFTDGNPYLWMRGEPDGSDVESRSPIRSPRRRLWSVAPPHGPDHELPVAAHLSDRAAADALQGLLDLLLRCAATVGRSRQGR